MNYVLSVIAFVATVVGVVGNTWKDGRPTITGWVAIVLALVVLILTVRKAYIDHRSQRGIAAIACGQVVRSVWGLVFPFPVLLADTIRGTDVRNPTAEEAEEAEEYENRVREFIASSDEQIVSNIRNIFDKLPTLLDYADLMNKYFLNDYVSILRDGSMSGSKNPVRWKDIFERTSTKAIKTLDTTLSSYRSIMSFKEIDAAQGLRNTWITQRMENLHQVPVDISLADFLKLAEKSKPQNQKIIYEEFIQAVDIALKVCSEQRK